MLISFAVQNYLSIRDRLEISFLAATGSDLAKESLPENYRVQTLRSTSQKPFPLLKSAIIYGANASGKTNILLALRNFAAFMRESYAIDKDELPFTPFLLDTAVKNAPTEFELTLLLDGTLYRYGVSLNATSVFEEWFFAADKGKERCLFTRAKKPDAEGYDFYFGAAAKALLRAIASQVRPNSLLLTQASLSNDPTARRIMSFVKGITRRYHGMRTVAQPQVRDLLLNAMKMMDIGLHDFEFRRLKDDAVASRVDEWKFPYDFPVDVKEEIEEIRKHILAELQEEELFYRYKDNAGDVVSLPESVQSAGTCIMTSLLSYILNTAATPQVLIIDEVEASLHPLLLRFFFQLFHALPHTNMQLLCSTHTIHVLHEDVFRRDQVYIAEKGPENNTTVKSLSDYTGLRQGVNVGKYYLEGRFGGIPLLSSGDIQRFAAQVEAARQEVAHEQA